MKRLTLLICVLAVVAWAVPTEASVLWQTLVGNELNVYEDQDRQTIFDVDGSGSFTQGDIFLGFVQFDNRSLPLPGATLPAGSLHAVFSHILAADPVVTPFGGFNIYDMTFAPTPAANALSLQTLLGIDPGNTLPGAPIVALYEDVNLDLIANSPGDFNGDNAFNILDFVAKIGSGNLDAVAGEGDGITEDLSPTSLDDHWTASALLPAGADVIANIQLHENFRLSGGTIGTNSFEAGLSILDGAGPNDPYFLEMVSDGTHGSLHEITIINGSISGGADLFYPDPFVGGQVINPFFSNVPTLLFPNPPGGPPANAVAAGQINGWDYYGTSSNADFVVFPIPEPASIVVWSLLGLVAGVMVWRRKRAA